jgi:hypothetical protein
MAGVRWHKNDRTPHLVGILQHGPFLRAFPIVIVVVWLVLFLCIRIMTDPPPASSEVGPFVLTVFVFLAIFLPWIVFLEAFGTQVVLSPESIQMHSFWRGTRPMRWEDVESIHYSLWRSGFVVKGHGRKFTLYDDLRGLALFAEAINGRVRPEKWAKASTQLRSLLPKGPYD